jgi:hypothetical protein
MGNYPTGKRRSPARACRAKVSSVSPRKAKHRRWPPNRSQLDVLITDATIDAYDESEQRMGFYTMIMGHLAVPFETTILGVPVVVESLEISAAEHLVAICRRGVKRQQIGILELPLPKRAPEGAEWIEAYRRWSTSGG